MSEVAHESYQLVPLERCRPGSKFPMFSVNPRKVTSDLGMNDFRDGLYKDGQRMPGCAFPSKNGEDFWVYIGERRLRALIMNAADHPDAPQTMKLLIEDITPEEALARSLAEQDRQEPLHPADKVEHFALLVSHGFVVEQIADRFFGTQRNRVRIVEQYLALGRKLTQKIRDAWRVDEIDQDCAQLFTLAPDERTMDEVFERLKKTHQLQPYHIRSAFQPNQGDAARFVNFVGVDSYIAAGGQVIVDLFEDQHTISDRALAMSLARDKLEHECVRLVEDGGWSWAAPMDDLPAAWQAWDVSQPKTVTYTDEETARLEEIDTEQVPLRGLDEMTDEQSDRFDALDVERVRIQGVAEMRSFTERQKKKSGCVVMIDAEGRLVVKPGLIRPVEPRVETGTIREGDPPALIDPPGDAEHPREVKAPQISSTLSVELNSALTDAAAVVVRQHFDLAMSIALAAFQCNTNGLPARLTVSGQGGRDLRLTDSYSFEENLAAFCKMSSDDRASLFALVVAKSLQFEPFGGAKFAAEDGSVAALLKIIPAEELREAIGVKWDAEHYFDKAPKAFAIAAIEDSNGREIAAEWEGKPKGEVAEAAERLAAGAGWLPVELRPPGAFWDGRQPSASARKQKSPKASKPAAKSSKKSTAGKVSKAPKATKKSPKKAKR
jgi:ParB family transcriptional regulator, chromosome partitioning protein